MDRVDALTQIDGLLEEYGTLRKQSSYDDLSDLGDEHSPLGIRLQAAIDRLVPPTSTYGRDAEALRAKGPRLRVLPLRSILLALRADTSTPPHVHEERRANRDCWQTEEGRHHEC